jgi:hypothetical protein
MDVEPPLAGGLLDVLHGAEFAGAHDLVLVEQEDGNTRRVDELVDLPLVGAELRLRPAIRRGLAEAVRLVGDQDVDAVLVGVHEAVEVLEQ